MWMQYVIFDLLHLHALLLSMIYITYYHES